MKRRSIEIGIFGLIVAVLLMDAVVIATNPKVSWKTLADAYDTPAPTSVPAIPGVIQLGGSTVIDTTDSNLFAISSISADGQTENMILSTTDLANIPTNPNGAVEVASTSDHYVTIYKLPAAEIQANIGPDPEGKIFVYVFTGTPLTCTSKYQYTSSDPTHQFEGPC
jgi:hypothetical protein